MNATWKCWLNRLMNRGSSAVRALGFTTSRPSRSLRIPGLRAALASIALGSALGGAAHAQSADSGEVRLGGGAAVIQTQAGAVQFEDPSASLTDQPPVEGPTYFQPPFSPYDGGQNPNADSYAPVYDNSIGYAAAFDPDRVFYRVGQTVGDIYGANNGYTNFNAFIPLATNGDNALWYFQPRGSVTDQGRGMASLGLGYRFYTPDDDRTWSSTFWWDGDGGHHAFYNQLGAHFSSVGRYLTWRGGFALPVGKHNDRFGSRISDIFFVNDNIGFNVLSQVETAYNRFDVEASTPIPYFGRYGFTFGLGGYYLHAQGVENGAGVSTRIEAQVTEDVWINGLVTSDSIFGSNFSLNMEFTLPDGMPSKWFRHTTPRDALFQTDKRNFRVAVGTNNEITTGLAIDPRDNQPLRVAHINPNLTAAGNGTVQNPFMSVLEFESLADADQSTFDLIIVRRRNDESDTNLNTTITLFDGQRLIGDGTLPAGGSILFESIINGSLQTKVLPGQTAGLFPLLTNSGAPASDVIRLANSNEVVGFTIDASGRAAGIRGTNIDSFYLHDLAIQNAREGIVIVSDTSPNTGFAAQDYGVIQNTTIVGTTGANTPVRAGISITQTNGTLDLLIAGNTVSSFTGEDANHNGIIDANEDANGNGVLDPGIGIEVVATGPGIVRVDDLTDADRPTGILNNTVTGNGTGLKLTADNSGTIVAAVAGNTISNNLDLDGAGVIALADNAGLLTLANFSNNTVNDNHGDGVFLVGRNGGVLDVPAFEDANRNGVLDVGEDLNGNGLLDVGFVRNTISGNDDNGVQVLADNATLSAYIGSIGSGNVINNNGRLETLANTTRVIGSGVQLTTLNGGVVNGGIDGNTISMNGEAGIKIAPDGGVVALDSISGNTITNNGFVNGQRLPPNVEGGDAIVFAPSNGGSFSVAKFSDNIIQGNLGAIIRVGGNGGIVDLGVIENTIFDRRTAGTAGIIFDATNSQITGILRNNLFIGSANNPDLTFGIGGSIRGGTLDLVIEDNVFDTNADAGIGLILTTSDNRTAPGTGTPAVGDAAEASLVITGNEFVNTLLSDDPRFDGSAISLQLVGQERDILIGQNDIDGDGIPDAPPIPTPSGSDPTTTVQPGPIMEAVIAGNLIGSLNDNFDPNDPANPLVINAGSGIDIRVSGDGTIGDLASVGSAIDRANLTGLQIGSGNGFTGNIIANNNEGIHFLRRDNGVVDNVRIAGNIIQNNLNDGIDIVGQNNGIPFGVEEILNFEIVNNQILNNGFRSDGTQGLTGRGIQLRGEGGSVLEVNIRDNIISGNRMSGIEARTFTDSHDFVGGGRDVTNPFGGGDDSVIYGVWERNIITNNGFLTNEDINHNGILDAGEDTNNDGLLTVITEGMGIALGRVDFVDPDSATHVTEGYNNGGLLIPDQNGDGIPDLPLLSILDNVINSNAEDGLHIYLDKFPVPSVAANEFRTTRISVLRNDISNNGEDGFNIHNPLVSLARVDLRNNVITRNGLYSELFQIQQAGTTSVPVIGDGVEIFTSGGAETILRASNNRIKDNNGRGVNILTSESAHLLTVWTDNTVSSNQREGFYLVNAPLSSIVLGVTGLPQGTPRSGYTANTWLPDFDSNHEMFSYGHLGVGLGPAGNTPPAIILPFLVGYDPIFVSDAPVTDITMSGNIIDNNGSVVPDFGDTTAPGDDEDPYSTLGGLVIRIGTANDATFGATDPTDGGVRANIFNNRMSGNVGRDVYFDGFVATLPPTVDNLPDPLIRFDLQFRNNRGGSLDVDDGFFVFYNNTAPNNLGGPNVKRPNPPFNNAGVLRDATVDTGGLFVNPNPPPPFLGPFPGFGLSTLRIETDGAAPDAFGNFIGNNSFNLIYSDFNPFDWLVVPNGTLFDPAIPLPFP